MAESHTVYLRLINVDQNGSIVQKDNATIAQVMTSNLSTRVIPDLTIPNSAGHPTVKTYLEAEAVDGFLLGHLDQYMVVTQKV